MTTTRAIELFLVDDDDEYRDTIVRRFTRKGFNVSDAPHAEAALEQAQQRDFDVAVFDMMMPGMSGLELLEQFKAAAPRLRSDHAHRARGPIETAVQAMKLGAYDFLTKPFPLAELEMLIQKAYDRRSLRKENVQLKTLLARSEPHDADGRRLAGDAGGVSPHRARRSQRKGHSHSRRKRHRQGTGRPRPASP